MTRLLVSVRDVAEARTAMDAGADFIDLKDPARGALGALPLELVRAIVDSLHETGDTPPLSATIGDFGSDRADEIVAQVARMAACGVDFVKVGVAPGAGARGLVRRLGLAGGDVVPVLLADTGIDAVLVDFVLGEAAFPAVMLDTADKGRGSLLRRVPREAVAQFVRAVQARGALAGLAGALGPDDLPALRLLAPDFAGFRSAVAAGGRDGALDARLVRELRAGLAADAGAGGMAPRARGLEHLGEIRSQE